LKTETIKDGKFHKSDNVRSAFNRLLLKVNMTGRSFKLLRKTGATILNTHPQHRHSRFLYLGHSPRGVSDINYSKPSQALFNEAIKWLGEQFGIE
jgi:hypothetical protein